MLPPGDVLKCALALARNEREARRVLLARLPTLEHRAARRPHRRQPAAVDDGAATAATSSRRSTGCARCSAAAAACGRSACERRRSAPSTATASSTRGEVEVDAGQSRGRQVRRIWLEPQVSIHPAVADAIATFDAVIIGPGSFYTSLMPILLVRGVAEALAEMSGPIILVANLLTEGRGMAGFTAADAVRWVVDARSAGPVDVVIANTSRPSSETLARYAAEHKEPLELGDLGPSGVETVLGRVLVAPRSRATIADRLSFAVWSVLSARLLGEALEPMVSPAAQTR